METPSDRFDLGASRHDEIVARGGDIACEMPQSISARADDGSRRGHQARRQLRQLTPQLVLGTRRGLSGGRWRRCTIVGDQIADRDVDLVADRRYRRYTTRGDGAS